VPKICSDGRQQNRPGLQGSNHPLPVVERLLSVNDLELRGVAERVTQFEDEVVEYSLAQGSRGSKGRVVGTRDERIAGLLEEGVMKGNDREGLGTEGDEVPDLLIKIGNTELVLEARRDVHPGCPLLGCDLWLPAGTDFVSEHVNPGVKAKRLFTMQGVAVV